MPVLSNQHWELFAEHIAAGETEGPAYEHAGYKATGESARVSGSRLLQNVTVAARIRELQSKTAEQVVIDQSWAATRLARLADDKEQPGSTRVSAIRTLIDMLALAKPKPVEGDEEPGAPVGSGDVAAIEATRQRLEQLRREHAG